MTVPEPMTAAERLEIGRWQAVFAGDELEARLESLVPLLEEEVAELERAVEEARAGAGAQPLPDTPEGEPEAARPKPLLAGLIQEGLLADVLQMLSANLKTGVFRVSGPQVAATIWFESGEVRHAVAGSLSGEEAFYAGIASPSGSFSFVEQAEIPPERTITGKTQFLILEGLRKMDEEGGGGGHGGG